MRKHRTSTTGQAARLYPTVAHWVVGMSQGELLADMAGRGETMRDVDAAFQRVLSRGIARLAQHAKPQPSTPPMAPRPQAPPPALVANSFGPELVEGLAFHEELACAGRGLDASDCELRRATLGDLFGKQDWDSVVAVRISGSSMEDEHIKDGDVALVDTRRKPRDGDIVLVHLAGRGQLVKRLTRAHPVGVVLESANPAFASIVVEDPASLTIHGVVVGRSGKV
jgi:hypothetical protein